MLADRTRKSIVWKMGLPILDGLYGVLVKVLGHETPECHMLADGDLVCRKKNETGCIVFRVFMQLPAGPALSAPDIRLCTCQPHGAKWRRALGCMGGMQGLLQISAFPLLSFFCFVAPCSNLTSLNIRSPSRASGPCHALSVACVRLLYLGVVLWGSLGQLACGLCKNMP